MADPEEGLRVEIASRLDWDRNRWMRRPLNAAVSPVKADADFMSRLMFLLRKVSCSCLHRKRLVCIKELSGAQRDAAVNSGMEKSEAYVPSLLPEA